jgi:hypothetical protein
LQGREASPTALLEQEKGHLYVVPTGFDSGEWLSLRVNKYSCFCCGQNHYSVPDHLVAQMVDVRLSATLLEVYYQGEKLCEHSRAGGHHGWHIRLDHYLDTLLRKPGALAGSLALKSADQGLREIYSLHFQDRPKVFVQLLHYQREENLSFAAIEQALEACLKTCPHQAPELDKIKVFCQAQAIGPAAGVNLPEARPPDQSQQAIIAAAQAQLDELTMLLPSFS